MNFTVGEEMWAFIMHCYDTGRESLTPTTRILIDNLLSFLQTNRVITSSYEADLIITLLLTAAQSSSVIPAEEIKQKKYRLNRPQMSDDNSINIIQINQIIEQLRLFAKNMEERVIASSQELLR